MRYQSLLLYSTHIFHSCHILNMFLSNSVFIYFFSTKVAVCHLWLDDGVAPKDILSSQLPVPSPHSKFPLLAKMGYLDVPLICLLLTFFSLRQLSREDMIAEFSQVLNW